MNEVRQTIRQYGVFDGGQLVRLAPHALPELAAVLKRRASLGSPELFEGVVEAGLSILRAGDLQGFEILELVLDVIGTSDQRLFAATPKRLFPMEQPPAETNKASRRISWLQARSEVKRIKKERG